MRPFISVVIPLYNKEKYIRRCIDSILSQSYTNFEIVIVDDDSKDNSIKIIETYYNDPRIRIIKRKNGGPAAARNTGIYNSKGDWVVFLDADDMLLKYALETFTNLISSKKGCDYYICNYYLGANDNYMLFTEIKSNKIIQSPFKWEFMGTLSDRPGSAIYKKTLLLKYPFNERYRRYEDAESQYKILNVTKPYQSSTPVMISFRDASEAASYRKDFFEDYLSNLKFEEKCFWEKMVLYRLLMESVLGYPSQTKEKYKDILIRLDYRILYKLVCLYVCIRNKFNKSKTYSYNDIIIKNNDNKY